MNAMAIEIVGLPGTGKTTLTNALLSADTGRFRRAELRRLERVPWLLEGALHASLPFLNQFRRIESHRWKRYFIMIQLRALARLADGSKDGDATVVVFDQGPVYLLSMLQRAVNEPRQENGSRFLAYWESTLGAWRDLLDYVIELEAPDHVLHERIVERGSQHKVRGMSEEEASTFFRRARNSRASILDRLLCTQGGPELIRIRTDRIGLAATVDRISQRIFVDRGEAGSTEELECDEDPDRRIAR